MYGVSYATTGFFDSLRQSDRLAAMGIHSSLLTAIIKLPARLLGAAMATLEAFTPAGVDHMAEPATIIGALIFVLAATAVIAGRRDRSAQIFPAVIFLLYTLGRSIAMPTADARFMQMEVAWGVILLMCALSAGLASRNRTAAVAAAFAAIGVLGFNVVSYSHTIIARHAILSRREEVDRDAFRQLRTAAVQHPGARVVLINDQAGMWAARAMLQLAGFEDRDFEILPTIDNWPSTDVVHDFAKCAVNARLHPLPAAVEIDVDYPMGCSASVFGRSLECTVARYRADHRTSAMAWAECLQDRNNLPACGSPLVHELPRELGRSLLVIVWHRRLSVPGTWAFSESDLPLGEDVVL